MSRSSNVWTQRWIVVLGGFLLAMVGGLSYSWGVFVEPMQQQYQWTRSEATLPLSVFMVFFALMMIPAGKLQERIGLRKQIRIGAVLFLLAYLLSALIRHWENKWLLVLSYGVLGGSSCGIIYSCIAPPIRRWFPDHPGFAVSLGFMGFGLASFIFAPLKTNVAIPHLGIEGTFVLLGLISFVTIWIASTLVKFPQHDWFEHLFGTVHLSGKASSIMEDVAPSRMLREKLFWATWASFVLVVSGSLLIIGILPSLGVNHLHLNKYQAAIPLSLFALTNGLSRPLAGFLSDRLGTLKLMIGVYLVQTLVFLLMPSYANTLILLNISAIILGIGIGVTLALYPVLCSEFFGVKHLGINYGLLFSAYGFGALSIQGGTKLSDLTGSYSLPLILAGIMSGLGTLTLIDITLYLRRRPH